MARVYYCVDDSSPSERHHGFRVIVRMIGRLVALGPVSAILPVVVSTAVMAFRQGLGGEEGRCGGIPFSIKAALRLPSH